MITGYTFNCLRVIQLQTVFCFLFKWSLECYLYYDTT